jgi:hypothetical protein
MLATEVDMAKQGQKRNGNGLSPSKRSVLLGTTALAVVVSAGSSAIAADKAQAPTVERI